MSHSTNNSASSNALKEARFIVITGTLNIDVGVSWTDKTSTVVNNMVDLESWKEVPVKRARAVANILVKKGVNLVITTEKVPEEMANALMTEGVRIVEYLDKDEALYLCRRGNIYPSVSCTLEAFSNADIAIAKSAREVVYGGKSYVLIDDIAEPFSSSKVLRDSSDYLVHCPQLLLRAPTSGLCEQYHKAIKRVFKMMYHSIHKNAKGAKGIPQILFGRGYFEKQLQSWCADVSHWIGRGGSLRTTFPVLETDQHDSFERYKAVLARCRSQTWSLASAFSILSRALGQIAHMLLQPGKLIEHTNLLETICCDENGEWQEKVTGVFDSLGTKQTILVQLLMCWHQLLRIDDVVAIRKAAE